MSPSNRLESSSTTSLLFELESTARCKRERWRVTSSVFRESGRRICTPLCRRFRCAFLPLFSSSFLVNLSRPAYLHPWSPPSLPTRDLFFLATRREILDTLGQFTAVISKLDAKWTKALLHRTQLSNPRFLQDLLATFQLISNALGPSCYPPYRLSLSSLLQLTFPSLSPSADNATPLPFIYNPLLERFLKSPEAIAAGHGYGYDVALDNEEGVEGLPAHVDLKTICSLDYLRFSSGVSQAYAIVNRLDRLMVRSLLSPFPSFPSFLTIASPSPSRDFPTLSNHPSIAVRGQIPRRRELHHLRPRQEFALRLQPPRNGPKPRPFRHRVDADKLRPPGGDCIVGM
jgi:hypothetical protein